MEKEEESTEALRAEIERLRRRVAELEEAQARPASAAPAGIPYAQIFELLPLYMNVRRANGRLLAGNRLLRVATGVDVNPPDAAQHDLHDDPEAIGAGYAESFRRALEGEVVQMPPTPFDLARSRIELTKVQPLWFESTLFGVNDDEGAKYVVELHRDVTEEQRARLLDGEREDLLRTLIDHAPIFIYAKDLEGRYLLANQRCADAAGVPVEQMRGKSDKDLYPEGWALYYGETDKEVIEARATLKFEEVLETPGGLRHVFTVKFPLFDIHGELYGVCGVGSDVTEHRRAEEDNRKLQEEMLRVQEATLRALSTPLIPIARGVLVMPLVGDVDKDRAQQVQETLLRGVSESRARVAILDVTGVTTAGPEVIDGLVQAARAVGLLGAQVVLTGVQPRMAQQIVSAGQGLAGIVTRGTLAVGIEYAMGVLQV